MINYTDKVILLLSIQEWDIKYTNKYSDFIFKNFNFTFRIFQIKYKGNVGNKIT